MGFVNLMLIILILLIVLTMLALVYLFTGNIQSRPPKSLSRNYNLKEYEYQHRQVFTIKPDEEENRSGKVIMYLHGGSYVGELYREHWSFFRDLIKDTGATIIVPDYPLTPQYKYTDVFGMVLPLYREVTKKVKKENFILMGDSAGGGIALALAQEAGRENLNQPNKLILISPWLDVTMKNPKIEIVQKNDKMLNKKVLTIAGVAYSGGKDMDKYLVSPINGPLDKLEDVIIYTGTYDILNPDVHIFEKLAKEKGLEIFKISAATNTGIKELIIHVSQVLKTLPKENLVEISNEEKLYTLEDEEPFTITMDGKTYVVNGPAVEKLMKRVNLNDNESMYYFHKTLDELGVSQRLKEMGIKDGDSVTIAGWELEWED